MRHPALLLHATLAFEIGARVVLAQPASGLLTNASDVLALSAEQASKGIRISIRGVVTAAEADWGGRFFVQDSSGGVFVENLGPNQPAPGDSLAVSGISAPGGYAPIITQPRWEKAGTASLPAPKPISIEQLVSGAEDSQRIEISGVVRNAQKNGPHLVVELASGGHRVHVYSPIPPTVVDLRSLVGAEVQVKGTAAASYNAPLRHLVAVDVYVPFLADFIVQRPAPTDPFSQPLTPCNNIGQYRSGRSPGYRVHVKGIVIYQRKGEDIFIKDSTGGLQIKTGLTLPVTPGDVIETVGFPGVEHFLPVLEDAFYRKAAEPRTEVRAKGVPIEELMQGLHHADLITLTGTLLDRLTQEVPAAIGESNSVKTTLVLQTTNLLFDAEGETARPNSLLTSIPIGSNIRVSGVCFLESDEHGKIESFRVLLPAPQAVAVIAEPSWLTAEHLLFILGIALVVIMAAASWIVMVSKRNAALGRLIQQRELDQKELQEAHDTLESRVKERTEQLKFEISARKEADVRAKAILAERTRLAKELHDTLEQTLTGVTLQLNTVAKLFAQNPETASYHLGLVRNMLRTSRAELRRSIWDLRSRELEEFDLSQALLISGARIADSAGMSVEVETKGDIRPLPEVVEENLLRIGQEAITNAVKHSGAHSMKVQLEFRSQNVILEIKDDGSGFTPEHCSGPNDGHFGLLGMAERAKRLDGKIWITSAPGQGTTIRVELPFEPVQSPPLAHEQTDHQEIIADSDTGR